MSAIPPDEGGPKPPELTADTRDRLNQPGRRPAGIPGFRDEADQQALRAWLIARAQRAADSSYAEIGERLRRLSRSDHDDDRA